MSIVDFPSTSVITSSQLSGLNPATMGAGARIRLTDLHNAEFISDGTNWKPVSGSQLLYIAEGTVATPLATLTGNGTNQLFTLPAGNLVIPAGLLSPNTELYAEGWFKRSTANGAFTGIALLGTGNSFGDNQFLSVSITNTASFEWRGDGSAKISSSTAFTSTGFILANQVSSAGQVDRTGSFNTASVNYVNFGASSSFIAPDTFAINGYRVEIKG